VESRCVLARENRGTFLAVYIASVRITVHAEGRPITREGHGSGEGRGASPGEVHDIALKAAETDATKRALATFGKPFGLELYRKDKKGIFEQSPTLQPAITGASPKPRVGLHPDDTTPIPRPSHYYGRRHYGSMTDLLRHDQAKTKDHAIAAAPLAPAKINKSQLAIAEPKRLRDKAHLKFVASQPCLVCGRQPSDPHHLRFAQPRAIRLKVSDEFTVPLCRGHHRQLHQAGDEITWWKSQRMKCHGDRAGSLGENSSRDGPISTRTTFIEWLMCKSPTLAELQAKLASVRREVRNLTVMGMDPKQTPEQAALIKELERSARAEMRLRTMALEYAKDQLRCHGQQSD
jgi:Rad52/22 family double-strand break repair protein